MGRLEGIAPTLGEGQPDGADPGVPGHQGAWDPRRACSILAFASPQLEALYQAYQARALNVLTWIVSLGRLAVCFLVLAQSYRKGAVHPHLRPPFALQLLTHTFPAVVTLVLLCFFPSVYIQHQWAVHVCVSLALLVSYSRMCLVPLWLRFLDAPPPAAASLLQKLQYFANENVYLGTMWYVLGSFPMGQLLDHAFVFTTLATSLAGNPALCASPLWPRPSVTMSPVPLGVAETLSVLLVQAVEPIYPIRISRGLSCPAALAFWQILGSMFALFVSGAIELGRRRAFLRTQEARAFLGSSRSAALLTWPWGGVALMGRIYSWVVGVFMVHALILAVTLDVFSI